MNRKAMTTRLQYWTTSHLKRAIVHGVRRNYARVESLKMEVAESVMIDKVSKAMKDTMG